MLSMMALRNIIIIYNILGKVIKNWSCINIIYIYIYIYMNVETSAILFQCKWNREIKNKSFYLLPNIFCALQIFYWKNHYKPIEKIST